MSKQAAYSLEAAIEHMQRITDEEILAACKQADLDQEPSDRLRLSLMLRDDVMVGDFQTALVRAVRAVLSHDAIKYEKDALRYRWLRDSGNWSEDGLVVCRSGGEDTCYGESLDAAIDAALAQPHPAQAGGTGQDEKAVPAAVDNQAGRHMKNLLQQRVKELAHKHGSIRAAARVLMVDHAYLYRLSTGEKDDPGDDLLRKLKLRRVVTYERTDGVLPSSNDQPKEPKC